MTNFFKNLKNNKYLFIINLLYFALGFINIHFALLGLICMILPLYLLVKTKKKTYCQGYCPRATSNDFLHRKNPLDSSFKGTQNAIYLIYLRPFITFI